MRYRQKTNKKLYKAEDIPSLFNPITSELHEIGETGDGNGT